MTRSLVLTVLGADKPGLVEALSRTVTSHDGNWLESRMARMAGRFAGIVRVRVPEKAVEALQQALAALESDGLRVQCVPGDGEGAGSAAGPVWKLALVGPDQPGIVREVAGALRHRRVNVEELSTACTSAPMSGEPLFQATARLRLPAGVSVDDLRTELEQLATSLMVDVSLDEETQTHPGDPRRREGGAIMPRNGSLDEARALRHLMDLLSIEGLSGREGAVAAEVRKKLARAGCKPPWMKTDRVNRRIPGDFETGNLVVKVPGTLRGPRLLFSGHMDTVPLCRGAVPLRRGRRIVSKGRTGLGGDNRTAVAALVTMVETLLSRRLAHPPLTVLFTVGEEVGLWGARLVSLASLGRPKMGFNIDGGVPAKFVVGAVGADRWSIDVRGRAAHAGVHPEHGVSAALIASRAIADVAAQGYFGKIDKGRMRGTSNVGTIRGGEATNQVTDHVFVRGESRSHSPRFVKRITEVYRKAFERAARSVRTHDGQRGAVDFRAETDYDPFRIPRRAPVIRHAQAAARSIDQQPSLMVADGGLDANWLNAKGLPTVTFGAGQHRPHTVDEYVEASEFLDGCRLAVALATRPV